MGIQSGSGELPSSSFASSYFHSFSRVELLLLTNYPSATRYIYMPRKPLQKVSLQVVELDLQL